MAKACLALDGLRLIPIRKKNMQPHEWVDEYDLRLYRKSIETVNSQLESLDLQHLRARTNEGFDIKVHASLIALWHTQALENQQSRYSHLLRPNVESHSKLSSLNRRPFGQGPKGRHGLPCRKTLCHLYDSSYFWTVAT